MSSLKITKGTWRCADGFDCITTSRLGIIEGSKIICEIKPHPSFDYSGEEAKANAQLLVDAGNVYQECGLTPTQLLEQRNSLMETLKELVELKKMKFNDGEYPSDEYLKRKPIAWQKAFELIEIVESK